VYRKGGEQPRANRPTCENVEAQTVEGLHNLHNRLNESVTLFHLLYDVLRARKREHVHQSGQLLANLSNRILAKTPEKINEQLENILE